MIEIGSIVKFTGPFVSSTTYMGEVFEVFEDGSVLFHDMEQNEIISVSRLDMEEGYFKVVSL
jgi:hypothetical protein